MNRYSFDDLNKFLKLDTDSPSGLAWKIDVMGGKNLKQVIKKQGQSAGSKEFTKLRDGSKVPLAWRVQFNKFRFQAHRVIWVLTHGNIDDCLVVDHLDGNPFNNAIGNLCLKTTRENNQNVKISSRNKSGVCGVFLMSGRNGKPQAWVATWAGSDGKQRRERFKLSQMTYEAAFDAAVKFRETKVSELIKQGMNYTDRHGK